MKKLKIPATLRAHSFQIISGVIFFVVVLGAGILYLLSKVELDKSLVQQIGVGAAALSIPGMWTILAPLQERREQLSQSSGYASESSLLSLNRRVYIWQGIYALSVISIFALLIFPEYLSHHSYWLVTVFCMPVLAIILPITLMDVLRRVAKTDQTQVFAHLLSNNPDKFTDVIRELLVMDDQQLWALSVDPRKLIGDLLDIAKSANTSGHIGGFILRMMAETLDKRTRIFILVQENIIKTASELYISTFLDDSQRAEINYGAHELLKSALKVSLDSRLQDSYFREIKKVWDSSTDLQHRPILINRILEMLMRWVVDGVSRKEFVYAPDVLPSDWSLELEDFEAADDFKKQVLNGMSSVFFNRFQQSRDDTDFALQTMFEGFFPRLFLIDFVPLYYLTIVNGSIVRLLVDGGWKAGFSSGITAEWSTGDDANFEQRREESARLQREHTYKVIKAIGAICQRPWDAGRCDELIAEVEGVELEGEHIELRKAELMRVLLAFKAFLAAEERHV